jgi:lysyl-tRNA synthetase class 2
VEGWPEESVQRLEKADRLRAAGVNPYPNRYPRTHTLGEVAAEHSGRSLEELEALAASVRIAGRVLTQRGHGKASFATVGDGGATLQVYVRQEDVGEQAYERFVHLVDRGDFIGVAGTVMRTRKGELSVQAREITFLSKALLPPPEKWHGLTDVEMRFRQRYLDLSANPEVRETFVARSRMVAVLRRFLDDRGYVEVETPMMQPIPGGALARPFVTHHNALDIDLYLRIAPELYLKRLVVGGLERVYEINRNFRNEGISSMHNPEFTMLEFYTAYCDCADVMAIPAELVTAAAAAAGGPFRYTDRATGQPRALDFAAPFPRVKMRDAIARVAEAEGWGIEAADLDRPDSIVRWAASSPAPALEPGSPRRELFDLVVNPKAMQGVTPEHCIPHLFDGLVQPTLWNPTFITDYPIAISPLAKARADDPQVADRFELFVAGMEVANGFSELNDPLEQRQRFLDQLAQRDRGDQEAHPMDEDYVRALGHGLPPTGGCGVGIDRLAMVLTGAPSIRDVILFPHMRPEKP